MRQSLLVLLLAFRASAQTAVSPDEARAALKSLDSRTHEQLLRCEVEPARPVINFALRFQAGYALRVPLVQYPGSGHTWDIVIGIVPDGEPNHRVYLTDHIALPPTLRPELLAETRGTFFLGEGHYSVNFVASDDSGRVCRKQWRIEADLGRGIHSADLTMPPNTAGSLSWTGAVPKGPPISSRLRRMTILMNSSEPYKPRARLPQLLALPRALTPDYDSLAGCRAILLGTLAALLEKLPGITVRLVVFDLDQQREILRQEGFSLQDMAKAAHAADNLEHWSVDYHDIQNQPGGWNFLAGLMDREIRAAAPPDLVVFLGPRNGSSEKMPHGLFRAGTPQSRRFCYLQFNAFPEPYQPGPPPDVSSRGQLPPWSDAASRPELPDTIALAVARLKGKTFVLHSPPDFAKAVESMLRIAAR